MKLTGRWIWALGLCLCACGGDRQGEEEAVPAEASRLTQEQGEVGIVLDSATAARMGLTTTALAEGVRREELELPAELVADPAASSFVRAAVSGRLRLPPGGRWPGFGERLEAGAVLASVGDALPVTSPRGGTVTRVLAQPGELVQAGQELLELTRYGEPLVRVALPPELAEPPSTMTFALALDGRRVRGDRLAPAPEADPVTHRPAWLYRIASGWTRLRPGTAVIAYASLGPARRGVVLPAGAVVQWDALLWAFVQRGPGRFVRVRLAGAEPVPGGWLVRQGFAAGERVVVNGAEQLLSEEFRARIVVGEEVGE